MNSYDFIGGFRILMAGNCLNHRRSCVHTYTRTHTHTHTHARTHARTQVVTLQVFDVGSLILMKSLSTMLNLRMSSKLFTQSDPPPHLLYPPGGHFCLWHHGKTLIGYSMLTHVWLRTSRQLIKNQFPNL